MQKISPFLWFDTQAEEAVQFYTSLFKNSKVGDTARYDAQSAKVSGRPEGSVMTVGFELCGQEFAAINGGPVFTFTPAISLFVNCETEAEIDQLWAKLSEGNTGILWKLEKYPFSEKYGWLNDKYGVSWQVNLTKTPQQISPALLFVGDNFGKAEAAINFYTSVFPDSSITTIHHHGADGDAEKGSVDFAAFTLAGEDFAAMEGDTGDQYAFTPATSFVVNCETQEEVDRFWEKLSADKAAEQCGWLTDKYGISWQIVPTILQKLLSDSDRSKAERVMKAMLQMKKLDIAALKRAAEEE